VREEPKKDEEPSKTWVGHG